MKKQQGFTLIELMIAIVISVAIFVVASNLIVSIFGSSTKQRRLQDLEQTKNDLRVYFGNEINWADNVTFTDGELVVDDKVYKLLDGRITKNGEYLTSKDVYVESWNFYKHSTDSKPSETQKGIGLMGLYYDDTNFLELKLDRIDPFIDFNWGEDSPDEALGSDTFSISWTGQIESLTKNKYTFYTRSNDGVKLWVNDDLLIDSWSDGLKIKQGSIRLEEETRYNIRLDYYENTGNSEIHLYWKYPGYDGVVPVAQLYPTQAQASLEIEINLSHKETPDIKENLHLVLSPRGGGVIGTVNSLATPTPIITASPTTTLNTPTPAPTNTVGPSPTFGPSPTLAPTNTPKPTSTPKPTKTPTPTPKPLP